MKNTSSADHFCGYNDGGRGKQCWFNANYDVWTTAKNAPNHHRCCRDGESEGRNKPPDSAPAWMKDERATNHSYAISVFNNVSPRSIGVANPPPSAMRN